MCVFYILVSSSPVQNENTPSYRRYCLHREEEKIGQSLCFRWFCPITECKLSSPKLWSIKPRAKCHAGQLNWNNTKKDEVNRVCSVYNTKMINLYSVESILKCTLHRSEINWQKAHYNNEQWPRWWEKRNMNNIFNRDFCCGESLASA